MSEVPILSQLYAIHVPTGHEWRDITQTSSEYSSGRGGFINSVKKHLSLWELCFGAVSIGTVGCELYATLPFTTKPGLALL